MFAAVLDLLADFEKRSEACLGSLAQKMTEIFFCPSLNCRFGCGLSVV